MSSELVSVNQLLAVKSRHSAALLRTTGVCGIDVVPDKDKGAVIVVHVDTDDAQVLEQIPKSLEGHTLRFLRTGPIRKLKKRRP
ncbi:MAG TPA: hypothetical protein VIY86_07645 [Pirellulaceae bacterium]